MAKEMKEQKAEQVKASGPSKEQIEEVKKLNKDVDVFHPQLGAVMPTSEERPFLAKQRYFEMKGRKNGPCEVLIKLMLPNGDFTIPGDTFDPVEERMDPATYRKLLAKKYITSGGEKVETKLLDLAGAKKK